MKNYSIDKLKNANWKFYITFINLRLKAQLYLCVIKKPFKRYIFLVHWVLLPIIWKKVGLNFIGLFNLPTTKGFGHYLFLYPEGLLLGPRMWLGGFPGIWGYLTFHLVTLFG